MTTQTPHSFHIPVMGLGYTIDTPVKVARFGISSVISIIEDNLVEAMREFYCRKEGYPYTSIASNDDDHRAKRITAYLDLLNTIVEKQMETLRNEPFEADSEIVKYFELLPDSAPLKAVYDTYLASSSAQEKQVLQQKLRTKLVPGSIDVNIMTKCDRSNYDKDGNLLPPEYADAMSALRGFCKSKLRSSVVFSAGMNPRLYTYCESFSDFFPDEQGVINKKIILKVSDYRSALIQGKFLAKKGLWVSEFRIESGLNCGGHAFATDGILLGPILEEFRQKKAELTRELLTLCNDALRVKARPLVPATSGINITVQGGIGTANEDRFLLEYYEVDGTGWGSPFLLVPEATNVDDATLKSLAAAKKEDYYLSHASPLGIPFNNFRKSSSEKQRLDRIAKGRPGSPCYKKFLSFSSEFTEEPICTSSREYQHLKIKQLEAQHLPPEKFKEQYDLVTEKDCLCEGLGAAALLKNKIPVPHKLDAVTICPGPNLAYFSNTFSLKQMVNHIYGKTNLLNTLPRPNMFVNELNLYVDYLKKEAEKSLDGLNAKQVKYLESFRKNLLEGIDYYTSLTTKMKLETARYQSMMNEALEGVKDLLTSLSLPAPQVA